MACHISVSIYFSLSASSSSPFTTTTPEMLIIPQCNFDCDLNTITLSYIKTSITRSCRAFMSAEVSVCVSQSWLIWNSCPWTKQSNVASLISVSLCSSTEEICILLNRVLTTLSCLQLAGGFLTVMQCWIAFSVHWYTEGKTQRENTWSLCGKKQLKCAGKTTIKWRGKGF